MITNFFISACRRFIKNPGLTAINILGLSLGIACCVMISLYLIEETSFDKDNANFARIYRVILHRVYTSTSVTWAPIPPGVRDGMIEFPEVEDATRIEFNLLPVKAAGQLKTINTQVIFVDTSFNNVFTTRVLAGDLRGALRNNKSVAVSSDFASKHFPSRTALGEMLTIGDLGEFTIDAVVSKPARNSHFHYEIILPISTLNDNLTIWDNNFGYYTYALLKDRNREKDLAAKIPVMTRKYLAGNDMAMYNKWREEGNNYEFLLQPLQDIHLRSDLKWEIEPNGNYVYLYLFGVVGFLVLVIAIINFMNLSTARYSIRLREIGIRKILGSKRIWVAAEFLMGSLLLSFFSLLLAILIIELTLPFLNPVIGHQLALNYLSIKTYLSLTGFALGTGVIAGIYPSILLSGLQSTQTINTTFSMGRIRPGFRNALITGQFAISFFLIVTTLTVYHQMKFMMTKRLGFNKNNVLVIDNASGILNKAALKNELIKNPRIAHVAFSSEVPGKMNGANTFTAIENPGVDVNMTMLFGDEDVFHTWGMEMAQGRNFMAEDFSDTVRAAILNETAVRMLGFKNDPIGNVLNSNSRQSLVVVGVVRDFHLESLQKEIRPLIFLPHQQWLNKVSVRIAGDDVPSTVAAVQKVWERLAPGKPFEYFFLDEYYHSLYASEQITASLLLIFSSMALIISVLGLFGLSSFTLEQRIKEIAIRKAMGATMGSIVVLLMRGMLRPVLLASLLAAPVAWIIAGKWLDEFAYRIVITPWPFLVASLVSFLIGAFTIVIQSYSAARNNPVDALRVT